MGYSKKPNRTVDIRINFKMQQKQHKMLMISDVKTCSYTYGTSQPEHMINRNSRAQLLLKQWGSVMA